MALIAVPNVSEGRNQTILRRFRAAIESGGARVLDLHADPLHNRSVFTLAGTDAQLIGGATALAQSCLSIDLTEQDGLHPRLGGLDVCPFVPLNEPIENASSVARVVGKEIGEQADLPVYLYGNAATRSELHSLPALRKGGLEGLIDRARKGLHPDFGPREIDPRRGVVCVGARGPLVAFNVVLRADADIAKTIAARTRTSNGGPPGIRALGLALGPDSAEISMNLVDPATTGIDDAFEHVAMEAKRARVSVEGTEIVGLPPEQFMPDPNKEAARLLIRPGRSLESALRN